MTEQDRVCIVVLLFQHLIYCFANNKICSFTHNLVCMYFKPVKCSKRRKAKHFVCCIVGTSCGTRKSGMRHVQTRNRRPASMLVQGHLLLQALQMVMNRTVLVSPQKLPMQDLMVGRRRKNACAKVKTPSLLLQTFTWMLWRICGLRRKRWKR